ncbi:MAG: D-alanine--D-alanine ligase family protein [Bdellovibrionota bacterium]
MTKKIRVAVLYGGKSGEHEISLRSGAFIIQNLDRSRFEVIPVSVDKTGRWQWNDLKLIEESRNKTLPIFENAPEMRLAPQHDGRASLEPIQNGKTGMKDIDVFFPIMHGPLCEDGTVQGLLELADVAYVGAGVLGSAIGMDKDVAKRLASSAGVPVAPYITVLKDVFDDDQSESQLRAREHLKLPVFVKPCNMGSSVGVHKVKSWDDLELAIRDAFQYDVKVLVEQGVNCREIEVAALEEKRGRPFITVPCEIITSGKHEFYSYDAKYLDEDGARVDMPAKLEKTETIRVQQLGADVFQALECSGMARIDFFLDRDSNKFYFNEINTIPGFTSISMYPKLMELSGIKPQELLTRLVELALKRQEAKHKLRRDFQAKE